jgi:MraZ protein
VVFTGTYKRSLDGKLRVLLPKRLRVAMLACESQPLNGANGDRQDELGTENPELYLTPGTDRCLELHTTSSLNDLAAKASRSAAGSRNVRSFSRLFYARAQQCDIDKQGRIRIPTELAGLAELEKELVFIGVGSHWELWNCDKWESYLSQHHESFDELATSTFDGEISLPVATAGGIKVAKESEKGLPITKPR